MNSNLEVRDKGSSNVPLNEQKGEIEINPAGTPIDESLQWVMPWKIRKHLLWKKVRETWLPIINVVIALLAFGVIVWQRQIMNTQTELTERSLRLNERVYV